MFKAVSGLKEEMGSFLVKEMKREGIQKSVAAVFLYGSIQKGGAVLGSDVDIAVVVAKAIELKKNIVTTASTGNAATALAGMCASIGMKSVIFVTGQGRHATITIVGTRETPFRVF